MKKKAQAAVLLFWGIICCPGGQEDEPKLEGTEIYKYDIVKDKPCDSETDQSYCTHNVAVRCNIKGYDNPNTFWSVTNCGQNVKISTRFGNCHIPTPGQRSSGARGDEMFNC